MEFPCNSVILNIFRKELKAGTAADTGEHVSVPARFTIDQWEGMSSREKMSQSFKYYIFKENPHILKYGRQWIN